MEGDDSPTGERVVALWNPPLEDPESGSRRSAMYETCDLYIDLVRRGTRTIVFGRSRKIAELIHIESARRLGELADRISPYRAGYTADDRRKIERRLFSGELLGITATNALELGIDVGGLDAALLCTFPGTVSSYRQQSGRARTVQGDVARGPRRRCGRPRPVLHVPPGPALQPAPGSGRDQPRQPQGARQPRLLRRSRTAADDHRSPVLRGGVGGVGPAAGGRRKPPARWRASPLDRATVTGARNQSQVLGPPHLLDLRRGHAQAGR